MGRTHSHLLGVGQGVGAAIVGDGDVALLNVDVGCPVLAHRAQLDQVAVRLELLQTQKGATLSKSRSHIALPGQKVLHASSCMLSCKPKEPLKTHLDGEEDVDGADDVVVLREDGPGAVDHGVGGRPLLAKVHHCTPAHASAGQCVLLRAKILQIVCQHRDRMPADTFVQPDSWQLLGHD